MPGREGSPPDPFEHGFEVAQRKRLDLPPVDIPDDAGSRWQRPVRLGWRVLLGLLAIVVLLAIGRAVTARNSTSLKADCTKLQLSTGEKSLVSRGPALLHWAVTAPAGTPFTVAIDPASGGNGHSQETPQQTMSKDCLAHGQVGVLVPPGNYVVVLTHDVGGSEQRVAVRPLKVTAS